MVVDVKREVCDGQLLKWMFSAGVAWLESNCDQVNHMNVFPVPDGDTGTNMLLTIQKAQEQASTSQSKHIGEISDLIARGALRGARGNSGTILAMLLRGFADGLQGLEEMDAAAFARACQNASDYAYTTVRKVMDPVEGTILTVAREAAAAVSQAATDHRELRPVLETLVTAARESLDRTPEMLPVLKQAGVVDSGGLGLVHIFEGGLRLLEGKSVKINIRANGAKALDEPEPQRWQEALIPDDEEGYGYDVQFLMLGEALNIDKVRTDISAMGWSPLIDGDSKLIKVHIHVHNPGEPISYAIGLGAELDDIVVENMQAQYHQYVSDRETRETPQDKQVDGIAVITVSPGDGLMKLFDEYTAARIIEGGQTMNPSTEDFLAAIDSLESDEIIILPNNKNIILAAEQAASVTQDRKVYVVPSRNVPQGVMALLTYGDLKEAGEPVDAVYQGMLEALTAVESCEVTIATRDALIDGVTVKNGQYIGLLNGKLIVSDDETFPVIHTLFTKCHVADDYELATIYYGKDVTAAEVDTLVSQLEAEYTDLEIESVYGGQPLYPYIISVE